MNVTPSRGRRRRAMATIEEERKREKERRKGLPVENRRDIKGNQGLQHGQRMKCECLVLFTWIQADDIFGGVSKNEKKREGDERAGERTRTEDRRSSERSEGEKGRYFRGAGTPRRSQIELR